MNEWNEQMNKVNWVSPTNEHPKALGLKPGEKQGGSVQNTTV